MSRARLQFLAPALLLAAGCAAVSLYGQPPHVIDQLPDEDSFAHGAGKNVQPFFEGWQTMPDGQIAMWFGYLNLNYEEEPDIPIGPNNKFDLREDLGQPTHFYPRRHLFVFKVDLPNGWDKQKRLVWSVTINGHTASANGWLQPEWEVDEGVMQMNIGPGGAPPVDPPNLAPKVTGASDQTTEVGKPMTLSVSATDDGIPKPRARSSAAASAPRPPLPPGATPPPRAALGLRIRWEVYRAPAEGGRVAFEPESNRPVMGAQSSELTTQATFSAPGTYWLRAVASDGMLETPHDVKVIVNR